MGFVVLTGSQSLSAAPSSLITHFQVPPRHVWYDNSCNMYDSAILRIPWFLHWTIFIVDRFHYAGHTCSNMFNDNLHRVLDNDRSTSAEVINSVIDKCVCHIAYLKGTNVIPFMRVLFGHLNSFEHVRDGSKKKDMEYEYMA